MALRVGVAGCGLIGGSVALALAAAGDEVGAWDPDPAVADALAGTPVRVAATIDDLADDVDAVVVGAPPEATPEIVGHILRRFPDVIVTDTASVKSSVISRVAEGDGAAVVERFVPGHPLAGRERGGIGAADAGLFRDAVWALCPEPEAPVDSVLFAARIAWATGARVLVVDAAAHDRAVAFSSHAPHMTASAIAAAAADAGPLAGVLSGGGLRDATRVAASDGALWWQILSANAAETLGAIDAQRQALDALVDALLRDDEAAFAALWDRGRGATEALLAARAATPRWAPIGGSRPETEDLLRLGVRGLTIRNATPGEWPPTLEAG